MLLKMIELTQKQSKAFEESTDLNEFYFSVHTNTFKDNLKSLMILAKNSQE